MSGNDSNAFELSRRKTLAALGTVGAASAGAGLGTSAFFSDEETYENNTLTAGSLDLKVDWEEHYSDWSPDEEEGLEGPEEGEIPEGGSGEPVVMVDGPEDVPMGYVGLPDPAAPLIAVWGDDLDRFMDNTSIEAYPDDRDDGIQNIPEGYAVCEDGADTPEDLDPTDGFRTLNGDTVTNLDAVIDEGAEPEVAPLINLNDIKPGDFGEATLSFHLCDNPGYVWLQGDFVEAAENGVTEPESKDPDEEGPEDEVITDISEISESDIELLDEIQTTWWYDDDGDNVLDGGAAEAPCVQIVLDASGSMTATDDDGISRNQEAINGAQQLAEEIIDAGGAVGVTFFSQGDDDGTVIQSVGSDDADDIGATQTAIATLPTSGSSTAIGEGILAADDDLANCPEDSRTIQVVITDGENNAGTNPSTAADDVTGDDDDDYTGEIYAVGTGGATEASLGAFARPSGNDDYIAFADDLENLIANLSQTILGEKVIFRGTLVDALGALADGDGIPLDGDRATAFDEFGDDPTAETRECYQNSVDHYIGFAWYLPVDHANEIQTDSVSFDLGFYTEQCRHNDGSGMEPENATDTGGNETNVTG